MSCMHPRNEATLFRGVHRAPHISL